MAAAPEQVLTVAQMVAAEERLMAAGTDVHQLMQRAGRGAAEYVRRMAAGAPVTVLCGPGNNGGDGYVIAEALREAGGPVAVVAAMGPRTDAARRAASLYGGESIAADAAQGTVLVDCLFGSGLNRALSSDLLTMLNALAGRHGRCVAVDLPSGIESDSGALLAESLPHYALCIALGAWKRAHFLMPAMATWDSARLVDIGAGREDGGAVLIGKPAIAAPRADAHKYRRGLVAVIGGSMPGAGRLAARAAVHGGAGYVKLITRDAVGGADWLVEQEVSDGDLPAALGDERISAVLVGPGLGRDDNAKGRLAAVLAAGHPCVVDADGLVLLSGGLPETAILTPHEGELTALEVSSGLPGDGSKPDRAAALSERTGAVVVAKGPDTVLAGPGGRLAFAPTAPTWLSMAGTGDVLAGLIASRLAVTGDPWRAATEAVWLHGEAARACRPGFHAGQLADAVQCALAAAL